jgi:hypothetical protein
MDGNLKDTHSHIWHIVGNSYKPLSQLSQVMTFDAFLSSVLNNEEKQPLVGILGQGLSECEIQSLHALPKHFPCITMLGNSCSGEVTPVQRIDSFTLENSRRLGCSQYECDFLIRAEKEESVRIGLGLLIQAGETFLEHILNDELPEKDYTVRIKQFQGGEVNIPIPLQSKMELKVTDIQVRKKQLSVKARIRVYQSGRLCFELNCDVDLIQTNQLRETELMCAEKTLREGEVLAGMWE